MSIMGIILGILIGLNIVLGIMIKNWIAVGAWIVAGLEWTRRITTT